MIKKCLNRYLRFVFAAFLVLFAHAARADCDSPRTVFDIASCEARDFVTADLTLTKHYMQLDAKLDPPGQLVLQAQEQIWLERRDAACTLQRQNSTFIDFNCALGITLRQDQILSNWLDNPSTTLLGEVPQDQLPYPPPIGDVPPPPPPPTVGLPPPCNPVRMAKERMGAPYSAANCRANAKTTQFGYLAPGYHP